MDIVTASINAFVKRAEEAAKDMQCGLAPYSPDLARYDRRESNKGNTVVTVTFTWDEADGGPMEDPFFIVMAASWRAVFSPNGDLIEEIGI